jgi:hypothetical protein
MALKSDNVEFMRIVTAILKMATGRNFSMSGINSGHLPTYQILMISDNVEYLWYCGGHFENGRINSTLSDFNAISYVGRL